MKKIYLICSLAVFISDGSWNFLSFLFEMQVQQYLLMLP